MLPDDVYMVSEAMKQRIKSGLVVGSCTCSGALDLAKDPGSPGGVVKVENASLPSSCEECDEVRS